LAERDKIILETFAKAISLVDEAVKTRNSAGESSQYKLLLWKAAAEAEYLAFQISIAKGLGDFDPSEGKDKDESTLQPLSMARTLLQQAQTSINSDTRRSYKTTREVVRILRLAYVRVDKPGKRAGSESRNE